MGGRSKERLGRIEDENTKDGIEQARKKKKEKRKHKKMEGTDGVGERSLKRRMLKKSGDTKEARIGTREKKG